MNNVPKDVKNSGKFSSFNLLNCTHITPRYLLMLFFCLQLFFDDQIENQKMLLFYLNKGLNLINESSGNQCFFFIVNNHDI